MTFHITNATEQGELHSDKVIFVFVAENPVNVSVLNINQGLKAFLKNEVVVTASHGFSLARPW